MVYAKISPVHSRLQALFLPSHTAGLELNITSDLTRSKSENTLIEYRD